VEPVVEGDGYRFVVRTGTPPAGAAEGTKLSRGANFRCVVSGTGIESSHIYAEALGGRMGARLLAVVAEGVRGRVYLDPQESMEALAATAVPTWKPEAKMPENPRWFSPPLYGLTTYGDLFTPRQLVALTTFSDLVGEARERARVDAVAAGMADDGIGLETGGAAATAYGEAVGVYLAFAVDRLAMTGNSLVRWNAVGEKAQHCFGRQALPMLWDYAEPNFLGYSTGSIDTAIDCEADPLPWLPTLAGHLHGQAVQEPAQTQNIAQLKLISTDPPYYDNIGYADLSDFFYVWLRRSARRMYPTLFAGMTVPKADELVATPYRHGNKGNAEAFFLSGMTLAMHQLALQSHPSAPVTIYYAFKQSETKSDLGTSSTGWETFLAAVHEAGFALTGTWPLRTEMATRQIAMSTNALASSIVLVCRRRPDTAATIARRDFLRELNAVLPLALDSMTRGTDSEYSPVAPVDLSQAIIGPGMAVFSKYAAVLEADGTPMSVKTALQLINRFLAEDDFDGDTQFCLHWFDQNGWAEGAYGEADVLARAKATSVGGLTDAGVVVSGAGKVRLLRPLEYPADWDPRKDTRLPVWEALHQLVRAFKQSGESGAAAVLSAVSGKTDAIRQLAYRLYTLCERRGWAEDARAYNELVAAWGEVELKAAAAPVQERGQMPLL
jgi:putative DNA methylase